MVPMVGPSAASAADLSVDPVRSRGPGRLASVRADFFLNPAYRLSEHERSLMTSMLHDLLATLANEIALAAGQRDYRADPVDLADAMVRSGLADRPGLIALMMRRADDYLAAAALAGRVGSAPKLPMLSRLVSDTDPGVAAAAMALILARGRRRDGFGQPRLEFNDMDQDDASFMVQAIAALIAVEPFADHGFSEAALRVAKDYHPEQSLEVVTRQLIDALERAGRDPDDMVEQAGEEGEIAILAHLLSRRAGVDLGIAWDYLLAVGQGGLAILARMAGLPRRVTAKLIAALGAVGGTTSIEAEMTHFDCLDDEQVTNVRAYWQLPAAYREARDRLGG